MKRRFGRGPATEQPDPLGDEKDHHGYILTTYPSPGINPPSSSYKWSYGPIFNGRKELGNWGNKPTDRSPITPFITSRAQLVGQARALRLIIGNLTA